MAKWDERDPRWIVEERPDAKNVNSWHWEELDCLEWTKGYLPGKLAGLSVDQDQAVLRVTECSSVSGELNWYNRKGKRFVLYELKIVMKWQGTSVTSDGTTDTNVAGTLEIPEMCQDDDDWSLTFKQTKGKDPGSRLYKLAQQKLKPAICQIAATMIEDLHAVRAAKTGGATPQQASPALTLPDYRDSAAKRIESGAAVLREKLAAEKAASSSSSGASPASTVTVTRKITWQANPSDVWECLFEARRVSAYTRAQCTVGDEAGADLMYYDGMITGAVKSATKGERVQFTWRLRDWPAGAMSTVTITLKKTDKGTLMALKQTGVPAGEGEATKEGWNRYFWIPIKCVFGYTYD